jgi:5-methylcytosine-specific restriction endonuclease McrA
MRIVDKKLYESNLLQNRKKNYDRKKKQREKNYIFILKFLSKKYCVDCGETDPIVLEFDHISNKKINISELIKDSSVENLKLEIDKCEIRCANCHRKKTAKDLNFYKYRLLGGEIKSSQL